MNSTRCRWFCLYRLNGTVFIVVTGSEAMIRAMYAAYMSFARKAWASPSGQAICVQFSNLLSASTAIHM